MTILEALKNAGAKLDDAGVLDSRLDAEYLLAHVLCMTRMQLLLGSAKELSPADQAAFEGLLERRRQREPLQYILGVQSFMGFDFFVNESVLIPRPETELLCEHALAWLKTRNLPAPKVLDLCTGSGALAVAIARLAPTAAVSAADISPAALLVARKNAKENNANVAFFEGDFLHAVVGNSYDLIVCNPPYIPTDICQTLQPEVLREPGNALEGGEDGLIFYRRLAKDAPFFLCPGGALFCEVGYDQAADVQSLLAPHFEAVTVHEDLSHISRIVAALSPKSLSGGNHVRQV